MCTPRRREAVRATIGAFLTELAVVASIALLRLIWRVLRLLLVALVALVVWASPRLWRVTRRTARTVRARWQARRAARVVDDLGPQLAITATPHVDLRWSTLSNKESNR